MAEDLKIIVLEGDETGQELLEQAIRVLDPEVISLEAELVHFDLSLDNRRETDNAVVTEAAEAMREAGFGIKAATITPEGKDDVGSPNRILREAVDGKVIIRTGRRIPGVVGPVSGVHYPISVVRMAVEDAYGAEQWREGEEDADDEVAYRTEKITRSTCRAVAEYAFRTAERTEAVVYGGPKWTVSPVYEGMLKEELDRAAERHQDVEYRPVLIDATYAGLISGVADSPLVIPALNRDGDCLSDLVLPMFGSIAGAESVLLAFDDDHEIDVAMAEAPHGTAPVAAGQGPREPDGDDPRLRGPAPVRPRARDPRRGPRLARDLRERARDDRRRRQDHRPRRRGDDDRVHRRRDREGPLQDRHLVLAGQLADVGREVLAGEGGAGGDEVGGGALEDDPAAVVAGAGAEVDDPVGVRHDRLVVRDDDDRLAGVDEPVEQAEQLLDVGQVQAGGRLVQDVDLALLGHVDGELESLPFAAGERRERLADAQVAEADVDEPGEDLVRCRRLRLAPAKNASASVTGIASTSLMSFPPNWYSRTSAWNRFPSHSSQVVATPAIIARSV